MKSTALRAARLLAAGFLIASLDVGRATAQCSNTSAIIADHVAVRDFRIIPQHYLDLVETRAIRLWGASHAHQTMQGLYALETMAQANSPHAYNFACQEKSPEPGKQVCQTTSSNDPGLPPQETPSALRVYFGAVSQGAWNDGPCGYWDNDPSLCTDGGHQLHDGVANTRATDGRGYPLSPARYDASTFGWCDDMATISPSRLDRYVTQMTAFSSDPALGGTRYILQTGPGGSQNPTTSANNQYLRDKACQEGKILFDFDDIEKYYPDGTRVAAPQVGCSGGQHWYDDWCVEWCGTGQNGDIRHPEDCPFNLWNQTDPAHTGLYDDPWDPFPCMHSAWRIENGDRTSSADKLLCLMKARALWWLLARLEGWDGGLPLSVEKGGAGVNLSWSGGIAPYTLRRANNAQFTLAPTTLLDRQPQTSFDDAVLQDGATYFYLVN